MSSFSVHKILLASLDLSACYVSGLLDIIWNVNTWPLGSSRSRYETKGRITYYAPVHRRLCQELT